MSQNNFVHPFAPIYDKTSQILILGSFPSAKSREEGFYYGNPRNRFWEVLARCFAEEKPEGKGEKCKFLLRHHIALYDAALSVEIKGSMDHHMKKIVPADLTEIFSVAPALQVFANGKKAYEILEKQGISAVYLPSTSPANAQFSIDDLTSIWCAEIGKVLKLPKLHF